MQPDTDRVDHRAAIAPGATLLLYTDGLVERRGEDITAGLDRLAAAAQRHQALGVDDFLDAVLGDLVGTELARRRRRSRRTPARIGCWRHDGPGAAQRVRRRLVAGDQRLHRPARGAPGRGVVDADRPAGLGRQGRGVARRPPRGHPGRRTARRPPTSASPPTSPACMGLYTEIGVVTRRDASPDAIINEIRAAATARHTALLADPPTDAAAKPDPIFAGVPLGLAHAAAQPAARRLDARAGHPPRRRPPRRHGLRGRAAHGGVPRREPRLRRREAGRRRAGHDRRAGARGQRPVRVRRQRRPPRRAAQRRTRRTRRPRCGWTARRSSGWPAAAAQPEPGTVVVARRRGARPAGSSTRMATTP